MLGQSGSKHIPLSFKETCDLRKETRIACSLKGYITCGGITRPIDCMVKNVTRLGAGVTMSYAAELPARVQLHLWTKNRARTFKVVWCNGVNVGLVLDDGARTLTEWWKPP